MRESGPGFDDVMALFERPRIFSEFYNFFKTLTLTVLSIFFMVGIMFCKRCNKHVTNDFNYVFCANSKSNKIPTEVEPLQLESIEILINDSGLGEISRNSSWNPLKSPSTL